MKRSMLVYPLMAALVISMSFAAVSPATAAYNKTYRYWSDSAAYGGYTWVSAFGGGAAARWGDMQNLGVYCHTDGWLEQAKAKVFIDGGRYANSPWTFGSTTYYISVHWKLTGTYTKTIKTSFWFLYNLYHMEGSTKVYDLGYGWSAPSSFNYDNKPISHYLGSVALSSGITYYMELNIELHHGILVNAISDMYYAASGIVFQSVEFGYYGE